MRIEDLRQQIDQTDAELLRLFQERMEISAKIAAWKKENDVPVLDKARERKKLQAVADAVPGELRDDARLFMSTLMGLSRSCQHRLNGESSLLSEEIGKAISDTPELFPREAAVACQGTLSRFFYDRFTLKKLTQLPYTCAAADAGSEDETTSPVDSVSTGSGSDSTPLATIFDES